MLKKVLNTASIIFLGIGILGTISGLLDFDIGIILFYLVWSLLGILFCRLTITPDQSKKSEEESSVRTESGEKHTEVTKIEEPNVKENNHVDYNVVNPQEEIITKNKESEKAEEPEERFENAPKENSKEEYDSQDELQYEHSKYKWYIYKNFTDPKTGEEWRAKYIYNSVEIERIDPSFSEIFEYDSVDIVQETNDSHVIAVKFFDRTLGYLKNRRIEDMANDFLNRKEEVRAQIERVASDTIFLRMYFCKLKSILCPPVDPITVKLVGNKNEMMQDNIDCCCEGDEIYVEEDPDKRKYLVWSGSYEIGYVPKSKQEYLEDLDMNGYEFGGEIVEISDSVKVKIQPQ